MERIKRILLRILKFLNDAAQLVWELLLAPFQYIHLVILSIFEISMFIYRLITKLDKVKLTKRDWDLVVRISFFTNVLGWSFVTYCLVTSSFIDYYFPPLRTFFNYIEYTIMEVTYMISNGIDWAYDFLIDWMYLIIAFVAKVLSFFSYF